MTNKETKTKRRAPGKTAITISIKKDLLDRINARAEELGVNRSQYLSMLARNDLVSRGILEVGKDLLPLPVDSIAKTGH